MAPSSSLAIICRGFAATEKTSRYHYRRVVIVIITAIALFLTMLASPSTIHASDQYLNNHHHDHDDHSHHSSSVSGDRSMEAELWTRTMTMIHNLPHENNNYNARIEKFETSSSDQRRQLLLDQCPDHVNSATISPPQQQQQNDKPTNAFQPRTIGAEAPPLFYAASFPGSGDKLITKYLVEKLTGLHVGDAADAATTSDTATDADNTDADGERMVAIRTQFPHTSGQLVSVNPSLLCDFAH